MQAEQAEQISVPKQISVPEIVDLFLTIYKLRKENAQLTKLNALFMAGREAADEKERQQAEQIAELQQTIRSIADKTLSNWSCIICLEHHEYYTPAVICSECGVYLCRGCSRVITNNNRTKCPSCREVFNADWARRLSEMLAVRRAQMLQIAQLKKTVQLSGSMGAKLEYYSACLYNGRRSWLFIDFARLAWLVMHGNDYKLRPILRAKYKPLLLYFDHIARCRILSRDNLLRVTEILKKRMPPGYPVELLTGPVNAVK